MDEYEVLDHSIDREESSSIDFKKYVKGFWKRKWIILSLSIVCAIPFYFKAKNQIPVYECSVTIQSKQFDNDESRILDGVRQAEIKSRSFNEKLASELGLAFVLTDSQMQNLDQVFSDYRTTTSPIEGKYKIIIDEMNTFKLFFAGTKDILLDSANIWDVVDELRSVNGISYRLNPDFVQEAGILNFRIRPFEQGVKELTYSVKPNFSETGNFMVLKMQGTNPNQLPQKLNKIAQVYVREAQKLKTRDVDSYREMIENQLKAARKNVENNEAALLRFNAQYPLSLDAEKRELLDQIKRNDNMLETLPRQRKQLSELLEKLEEIPDQEYEEQYRRLVVHEIANFPAMATESNLKILRGNLTNFENRYDEITDDYSKDHPDAVPLSQKIIETQNEIIEFASKYRNKLAEQEAEYRKTRNQLQIKQRLLPDDEYRLMELERKKKVDEDLYTFLLSEMQKLQVSEASEGEAIRILDPAVKPTKPINPSQKSQVILGSTLGFLLGLVISIGIDVADRSLKTINDVEKYLNLTVLGAIPIVTFKDIPEYRDDQKAKQIDKQLVTHDYSPTPIGEAYRALRTQLMFSKETDQIHSLLITSISPEEGKSFTASNLAIILAQQKTNTLLVDGDLRRGVLHNTFGVKKDIGLTNYLSNNATLASLVQPTHIPNLSLISCGQLLPNPSELLGSIQMKRFLADTKRKFNFIVFDAPPLDAATDAVVLGTLVDAVVVVIRAGKTNRTLAKERLEILKTVPANLIGVIINGTQEALLKNYYSYYHY